MSDQDDALTPEEMQAKANSAKISRFIANIGWQFVMLTIVIYATYHNNYIADLLLTGYGWLVGFTCVVFFLLVIKPLEKVAMTAVMDSPLRVRTPTEIVLRGIRTIFSIIEISFLVSFDWHAMAGLWFAAEALQYAAAFKLKLASELGIDPESMLANQIKKNPAWGKNLDDDMDQYQEELLKINNLIRDIEGDGDDYKDALEALIDDRIKLVDAMEARITRAAHETIKDIDKE